MQTLVKSLIDHLREQGAYVLASSEDTDYYRKNLQPPKPKIELSALAQKPQPEPETLLPPEEPKTTPLKKLPQELSENKMNSARQRDYCLTVPKAASADFLFLRGIVKAAIPELKIIDEIPSDAVAKKISERWKTKNKSAPISVIVFQEPPEQRAFLEQIARALDVFFGTAKIVSAEEIESQNQWDSFLSSPDLKLIISCDYTLWQLSNLMLFYKETPAKKERLLGNVSLFLLPDLSLYLKDPLLKRSLWKALTFNFK